MAETEMIDRYIVNMCEIDDLLDDVEIMTVVKCYWIGDVLRRSSNFSLHPIFGSTT